MEQRGYTSFLESVNGYLRNTVLTDTEWIRIELRAEVTRWVSVFSVNLVISKTCNMYGFVPRWPRNSTTYKPRWTWFSARAFRSENVSWSLGNRGLAELGSNRPKRFPLYVYFRKIESLLWLAIFGNLASLIRLSNSNFEAPYAAEQNLASYLLSPSPYSRWGIQTPGGGLYRRLAPLHPFRVVVL